MTDEATPNDTPQSLRDLIAEEIKAALNDTPDDAPPPHVEVPKVDHVPTNPEEVQELAGMLADFRREMFDLRVELRQRAGQQVQIGQPTETIEDRTNRRLEQIAQHSHYCPGCGELYNYPRECTGPKGGHPHAAIEVVSTDELGGDPRNHTAAPATDPTGLPALAA